MVGVCLGVRRFTRMDSCAHATAARNISNILNTGIASDGLGNTFALGIHWDVSCHGGLDWNVAIGVDCAP